MILLQWSDVCCAFVGPIVGTKQRWKNKRAKSSISSFKRKRGERCCDVKSRGMVRLETYIQKGAISFDLSILFWFCYVISIGLIQIIWQPVVVDYRTTTLLFKVYLHEAKTLCLYGVYLLSTRVSFSTLAYGALAAPFLFPGRQIVLPSYHREQFGGSLALSPHSSLLQCQTRPRRRVHCLLVDRKAQ
jgi:hypothetical protein